VNLSQKLDFTDFKKLLGLLAAHACPAASTSEEAYHTLTSLLILANQRALSAASDPASPEALLAALEAD